MIFISSPCWAWTYLLYQMPFIMKTMSILQPRYLAASNWTNYISGWFSHHKYQNTSCAWFIWVEKGMFRQTSCRFCSSGCRISITLASSRNSSLSSPSENETVSPSFRSGISSSYKNGLWQPFSLRIIYLETGISGFSTIVIKEQPKKNTSLHIRILCHLPTW